MDIGIDKLGELTAAAPGGIRGALLRVLVLAATAAGCSALPGQQTSSSAPASAPASTAMACNAPPLGSTALFLRGSMNQWQPVDEHEFAYRCDAYYLNIGFSGQHPFKIADAQWSEATVFANPPGRSGPDWPAVLARGTATGNLQGRFDGPQMLRLAIGPAGAQLSLLPGSFDDPRRQPVSDPVALSLRHDSRELADKQPEGMQELMMQLGSESLKIGEALGHPIVPIFGLTARY